MTFNKKVSGWLAELSPNQIRIIMILSSCLLWVFDTVVDLYIFMEEDTFLQCLLFDTREVYIRLVFSILLILIGEAIIYGRKGIKEKEKEILEERVRSEQEQEMNRLKTRFMSTATHEIRTPLASIQGYTELIQVGEMYLSGDQRQYFEVIQRNVGRLTKLTDDLLDLQQLEEGRIPLNIEKVDVYELVLDVENEFTPMLIDKDQSIRVDCANIAVCMDRLRVMQVFVNLLSNASKFSQIGAEIMIDVAELDDCVRFSVADRGVGIGGEDLEKLFVPFPGILVDGNVSGTGLGLSICRGIVELHGGEIWAESDGLGKGSTFSFSLPTYYG